MTAVGLGSTAGLGSIAAAGPHLGISSALVTPGAAVSERSLAAAVGRAMRLPSRFAPSPPSMDPEFAGETNRLAVAGFPAFVRTPSPIEGFARRVQREGLPLAHLWQSKSALLSLGFNAKGKPGLWLTQKIH